MWKFSLVSVMLKKQKPQSENLLCSMNHLNGSLGKLGKTFGLEIEE